MLDFTTDKRPAARGGWDKALTATGLVTATAKSPGEPGSKSTFITS